MPRARSQFTKFVSSLNLQERARFLIKYARLHTETKEVYYTEECYKR